jgi:hypothetical protein
MEDIVAKEERFLAAARSRGYHLICLLTPSHLKRGLSPQPRITQEEKGAGRSSGRSPNQSGLQVLAPAREQACRHVSQTG